MEWLIIIVITYLPIVYRIHKRLEFLENEVFQLTGTLVELVATCRVAFLLN
ncbi:hypothetical protein MKY37_00360 [Psychrobacillus sp. FSL K6-2836]|uniref:hypothetical protein n=1 Tax=Psychrobacillus sp. FSL K6-2836 TaxID=2921548 RepID=UPI0030F6CFCC